MVVRWLIGTRAFLAASLLAGSTGWGAISDFKQLSIDFTDPKDAQAKATWADPRNLTINGQGLGWDSDAASLRDGWIQTKPLAIGYQWRPPQGAGVTITIHPAPKPFKLNNGQTSTPYIGAAYVRYSPDRRHWSSWHECRPIEPHLRDPKKGRVFRGGVRVPQREQQRYRELLKKFASLKDTWWPDDEEKAVHWIIQREPDFFATQQPIVGYIEVLFEAPFYGGQRVRSIHVSVGYVLSGMVAPPRDGDYRKTPAFDHDKPWRFADETPTKNDAGGDESSTKTP